MRNVRLGIVLMLLLPAPALSATPEIRATITSDPGDPVGIGRQYTLTVHDGTWNGYGGDFNHDGLIDTVFVNFGGSNGTGWNFEFSTQHMNAGLLPGFYDKAGLAPFETRGYPTMSVKRGSGCDALLGNFTILEARFENSKVQPGILSFAVAFEQHCRANDPALRGILLYNYTTPSDLVILTRPPAERLPVGRPFSLAFEALGGVPPYSWDAGEGRMLGIARFEEPHLPPGLALDTTGTLSGTPAVPGRFNFSVTVTDSAGRKTSEAFRIETEIRDSAPPVSELHMESEKGDWIGHGSTFDFRDTVAPQVTQRQEAVFQIQSWFVRFSMRRTLRDLAPGMYDNAMRDSFEDWGRPGMSISGDGRGCNILSGSFVILNYEADFSGPIARLNSFAARFEQHCEGWSPALRGHLYYKYEAPAHTSIVSFPELPEAGATQSYGQTLVAAGGEGPYTWDLVGEDLPAGLVLSADGKLSGVPDKPGLYSFRIRATDSQGVQSVREFSLEVITPLAIAVPTPLNPAVLLKPYSVSLEAVGGTPPYSWSIHNEGAYRVSPPGLSLSPDGVLAGIPFVSSTHYVDVQVTDAKSRTANGQVVVQVFTQEGLLGTRQLILESMPGDYVGMGRSYLIGDRDGGWNAYATARSATGLVDDVRIQFTGEGINFWTAWFSTAKLGIPMQPGLYLNAQRNPFQQDGHPGLDIGGEGRGCNELDGAFRVLDAEFDYATERPRVVRFAAVFEQYCEHVTAPLRGAVLYGYSLDWPVRIVSLSPLTEAYVGLWYEHAIIADGGSPPYSFSLIQGGLPPGLALDPDGTLRGTPGSTGLFEFSIRVTDGTGNWSVRELELNVIDALTVTSVPLPAAIRGQPFHCVLTASGGTPPYKWAYADGLYGRQLPAGLSMSPDGVIEGIPIVSSVQYFPVRVTDARFRTVTVDFALEVYMPDGLLGRKELTMTSESGDWVGQGLSYSYDDRYGKWEVNASDLSGDGSVDGVEISLWPAGTVRDFWSLSFSTAKAGVALAPGTYANAQRTPFEAVGFPGMSVSGLGRGCNMLTGTFTVLDAVFDYSEPSPSVVSFAATFEQYCDGRAVPLRGKIAYGSVK